MPASFHKRIIGVFDSGFGGLTVLRALLPLIPDAHYVYLGDTARLPYGAKSQATIARYAVSSAKFLEQQGADLLVIACNTATALALPEIRAAVAVPVVGVIEPGARAARAAANGGEVLVLATDATIHSHAYRETCAQLGVTATEKACPLLVPLVEEGWTDHPVTRDVLRIYLTQALLAPSTPNIVISTGSHSTPTNAVISTEGAHSTPTNAVISTEGAFFAPEWRDPCIFSEVAHLPKAVLLGCTHYPLIAAPIEAMLRELGSQAIVVDSAQATAEAVAAQLGVTPMTTANATFQCYATDSVEKFQRLGSLFLNRPLNDVKLLDLGG